MFAHRIHPSAFPLSDTTWMVAVGFGAPTSTEILSLDSSTRQSASIPKGLAVGCAVKINETTALIMGGNQLNTYYYSIVDNKWSLGPSVNVSRKTQSCGLVEDLSDSSTKYIVLTGGKNMATTEILQVGTDSWVRGPDFPNSRIFGAHMRTTLDGKALVLSGGSVDSQDQKQLYSIQCDKGISGCEWEKLPMEMEHARRWHTSVFLPESEYPCIPDHN